MSKDKLSKEKMKVTGDRKLNTSECCLIPGDYVLTKTKKTNKSTPYFAPKLFRVTVIKGSMVTAVCGNESITRNSSFFKKWRGEAYREVSRNLNSFDFSLIKDRVESREDSPKFIIEFSSEVLVEPPVEIASNAPEEEASETSESRPDPIVSSRDRVEGEDEAESEPQPSRPSRNLAVVLYREARQYTKRFN